MNSLIWSAARHFLHINLALSLSILANGCSSASLTGDQVRSKANSKKSAADQKPAGDKGLAVEVLPDADNYEQLLASKDYIPKMSEIPVGRLCSNHLSKTVQTNFFLADKGVELVFVSSNNVKKVVQAGDLSETLLSDVLADGKLKVDFKALGLEDGIYTVGLCDATFPKCKEQVVFSAQNASPDLKNPIGAPGKNGNNTNRGTGPNGNNTNRGTGNITAGFYRELAGRVAGGDPRSAANALIGRFGSIHGLKISEGLGKADSANVLLNVNLTLLSKVSGFNSKVFDKKSGNSKRQQRLGNNINKGNFLADIPKSDDPRADDVEDCDVSASPLVLDFGNDGVFGGQHKIVSFDINADGRADQLANTLDRNDYLLAMDRNQNGKIDDATELFGNYSGPTSNKSLYQNGFEALAILDSNHDGAIDAKDANFKDLTLWQMGSVKMLSLSQKDVVSIPVAYKKTAKTDFASGNSVLQAGTFKTASGKSLPIVDLWYRVSASDIARK